MLTLVLIFTLVMNVIAFCLMGADKAKAKKSAWRIPEKVLFLFAALMGGVGGTAGMLFFRHKTKHWYFRIGFPLLAAVQVLGLIMLLGVGVIV